MPNASAAAAAVRGSIVPRLFTPSVSSRTTFDFPRHAAQPVDRRGEPAADRGAVLEHADPELAHRPLEHRVVER